MRPTRSPSRRRWLQRIGAALLVFVAAGSACAGETPPAEEAPAPLPPEVAHALETIRGADIIAHARLLADPAMRGREPSTPEARKAARYVADAFRDARLRPGGTAGTFYQVFKIRVGYQVASTLTADLGGEPLGDFERGRDYAPVHLPGGRADVAADCVLAGYGITAETLGFDEYRGIDARGKAVVVFSGVPWGPTASAWLRRVPDAEPFDTLVYKARNAAAHGAACLLVVENPAGWRRDVAMTERLRVPDTDFPADVTIPVVQVTRALVSALAMLSADELRFLAADIGRDRSPASMPLRGRRIHLKAALSGRARLGRNVLAVLPGRDAGLRKEAVVVGAHYDHLGEAGGDIFFGANDNAAGCGALLAVARAMASLPRPPARTVVFAAFDAEELGRCGSKDYIARPCIPLAQTVLMINFDMIGRNEPDHIFAVGTRSSADLHRIHRECNRHVGLVLEHPASFRLGLSDHSPFYFADVPILYLFGGRDPDYNTPGDTWDKLIPGKVEKVARLAFLTAREVADRAERLVFVNDSAWTATGSD
ncbi:MAG: M28 family peptidase [Phycisphaerae bacterium]